MERVHALGVAPTYAHTLTSGSGKGLRTASLVTVVFGNLSAFQPFRKADSKEPSGITLPTVVTLTEIPHTSHMS